MEATPRGRPTGELVYSRANTYVSISDHTIIPTGIYHRQDDPGDYRRVVRNLDRARCFNEHIMPVGTLLLEISIPHAQSLKDRRQLVRSLKDKLRHGFNLSVAELDEAVVWNRATIGVASISGSAAYLKGQLKAIETAAQSIVSGLGGEITDVYAELFDATNTEEP